MKCNWCEKEIETEKPIHKYGMVFHKKCRRKAMKSAKRWLHGKVQLDPRMIEKAKQHIGGIK